MVYVLTARCDAVSEDELHEWLKCMPDHLVSKARNFTFPQDARRYLLGKLLLVKGAAMLGFYSLKTEDIRLNDFNRPYITNGPDFNISHSGNYVLCALSSDQKVGIDVEEIREVDFALFTNCFTENEWSHINDSPSPTTLFYKFWTRKEAVIKADGRGLNIPLQSFEVVHDLVTLATDSWYIRRIDIAEGYMAHFVTNAAAPGDVLVRQIV